jgi:carboxyl-terminal processing protease
MFLLKSQMAALSLFLYCTTIQAQMPADQQQAIVLKRMIERNHFSPRAVNDSFSADVFQKVITSLDEMRFLFTADEYKKLSAHRYMLDDELQGGAWQFLNQLTASYGAAIKRADSLVNVVLQKPLDVTIDDKVTLSRDKQFHFPASIADQKAIWTKWFKWHLLNSVYDMTLAQTGKTPIKEVLAKNEAALRQKLKRSTLAGLQDLLVPGALALYVKEAYLMAVALSFDPHTEYLSPKGKDNLQAALSTNDRSFGFLIDERDGKVVIQHLIPGGPAWKSGEVHRNDQILQLSFDGKEPTDVTMLEADEVAELVEATTANTIALKIKKGDGSVKTVSLRKEKIELEGNGVKGYVLKGIKKIGYISLPDFYTSWEDENGSSCAEDVAKEIVNLKKEGIEGLILDVRFNGGGSMQEAQQLIGIFINEGPLFGLKDKGKASFLKDPNRGTIWSGPMAVMINGQSASASEVLAASLQDYNRAVVVGSSSFGKATMQQVFAMDTTAGSRMVNAPFGFVKITLGKLYRLDGGTAQLNGVKPDVYLPDAFDVMDNREKDMPNVLAADTIKRNSYYKPLPPLPLKELEQASNQRIATLPEFVALKHSIQQFAAFYKSKQQVIPLKLEAFEKWRAQNDVAMMQGDQNDGKASTLYAVANHQFESQRLQNNVYAGEINSVVVKNLQQDMYIEEVYRIVSDLIQRTTLK